MKAWIAGISAIGPGIGNWATLRSILTGEKAWDDEPLDLTPPEILSPRVRRRTSAAFRLALNCATDACHDAGRSLQSVPSVFASAVGDGEVSDAILTALTLPDKPISPTHFHNSVHNAAAGYWSIGTGNMNASSSIAAGDAGVGAGLTAAMIQLSPSRPSMLMVASDMPMPERLAQSRPIGAAMGVGIFLTDERPQQAYAGIDLLGADEGPETAVETEALRALARSTPAGRALPLLEAVAAAAEAPREVVLVAGANGYKIRVRVSA